MKNPYAPPAHTNLETNCDEKPVHLAATKTSVFVTFCAITLIVLFWVVAFNVLRSNEIRFGRTHRETQIAAIVFFLIPFTIGFLFAIALRSRRSSTHWIGLTAGAVFALALGIEDGFARLFWGDNTAWAGFSLLGMSVGCSLGGLAGSVFSRCLSFARVSFDHDKVGSKIDEP